MLYARIPCKIRKQSGTDVYGQAAYGDPAEAMCAVVKLDASAIKTSVRTDSSASRGSAEEVAPVGKLLFPPIYDVAIGDLVLVHGLTVKVKSVQPRFAVFGGVDHNEVDLMATENVF